MSPYGFIGLNTLERLELIGNEFDSFNLDYLKDMENLNALWLDDNNIKKFIINYNAEAHETLKVLSLWNNKLVFLNYKLLYNKLPNLKELFIGGNPWSCEFVANMYTFFSNRSVMLCANNNCSVDDTEDLVLDACKYYFLNATQAVDFGDDFVLDSTHVSKYNLFILISSIYVVAILC